MISIKNECINALTIWKAFYETVSLWCKRAFVSVITFFKNLQQKSFSIKARFLLARIYSFVVNLFVVLNTLPLKMHDMKETKLYKNTYWMRIFKCISSSAHYCYFYVYRIIYPQCNNKSIKKTSKTKGSLSKDAHKRYHWRLE